MGKCTSDESKYKIWEGECDCPIKEAQLATSRQVCGCWGPQSRGGDWGNQVSASAGLISAGLSPHTSSSYTISSPVRSTNVFLLCLLGTSTYTSSFYLRGFPFLILNTKEPTRPFPTLSNSSISLPS